MSGTPTGTEHCVYCGDYYQCRDHVIPVLYTSVYRSYKPGDTVHCCQQCNTLLGSVAHFTIQDRAVYLLDRYRHKYWKHIIFPAWELDEVQELDYSLRIGVEKRLKLKALYLNKLSNLELVSQGHSILPIDPLVVRGRTLAPLLSYLDSVSALARAKSRDDTLQKRLRGSIALNLPKGILYRTYRHKDGMTVNVFNTAEFCRRYKLKTGFANDENSDWRLLDVKPTDLKDKSAVLEIAVQMVKAGRALC